jgi:hypothetical protein
MAELRRLTLLQLSMVLLSLRGKIRADGHVFFNKARALCQEIECATRRGCQSNIRKEYLTRLQCISTSRGKQNVKFRRRASKHGNASDTQKEVFEFIK